MNAYNYRIDKSEDKSMSAEAKEALDEFSEILFKKHLSPQDIKMLMSQLRTSAAMSSSIHNFVQRKLSF